MWALIAFVYAVIILFHFPCKFLNHFHFQVYNILKHISKTIIYQTIFYLFTTVYNQENGLVYT